MTTIYEQETMRCNFASETLTPESDPPVVVVPRDSEWSGFGLEMAQILAEVAA